MTPDGSFDRRLTTWLEEDAAPRAPHGFSEAVTESVDRKRQLPSWATTERWISMETRARIGAVPRTAIVMVTLAILTALAVAVVAGSSSKTLPEPFGPAANGPMAYHADGSIWLLTDEGEATVLTAGSSVDSWPAWSRDGSRLAHVSNVGGAYELVTINEDGTDPVVVATDLTANPRFVRWKPDSTAVAFRRVDESLVSDECADKWSGVCGSRIWVAAADGSNFKQIGPDTLDAYAPAWSPDGSTIVFSGRVPDVEPETFGLYLMDSDGRNTRRLSDVTGPPGRSLYYHDWSPDGNRIATKTDPNSVYVIDVESGDSELVYSGPAANHAVWSPDGTALATSQHQHGGVIVRLEGEATTVDEVPAHYLHWTPDGTMLVGVTGFSAHPVVGDDTETQGGGIHLFDNDGELLRSFAAPGVEWAVDFQRLAP